MRWDETAPAKYYTDRDLHERELEVFFRKMWVCVGRFSELPHRGSFIMRHVAARLRDGAHVVAAGS